MTTGYLLDTHTFLWFIGDDVNLSPMAKRLIETPDHGLYLSIASVWEMAIKVSLGKLILPFPFTDFIVKQLEQNDIELLAIKPEHAGIVVTLPFHHRDPFDRLIIAQSIHEHLPIVGRDSLFDSYPIIRHW